LPFRLRRGHGPDLVIKSHCNNRDLTLFEVDEAANRIREEADQDANIIVGAGDDEPLDRRRPS
jgi:cell division protein FtsZ